MNNLKELKRLKTIDKLISQKGTGAPADLAKRLGISKNQLFRALKLMKWFGASIKYSKKLPSYYYTDDKAFFCGFVGVKNLNSQINN